MNEQKRGQKTLQLYYISESGGGRGGQAGRSNTSLTNATSLKVSRGDTRSKTITTDPLRGSSCLLEMKSRRRSYQWGMGGGVVGDWGIGHSYPVWP